MSASRPRAGITWASIIVLAKQAHERYLVYRMSLLEFQT